MAPSIKWKNINKQNDIKTICYNLIFLSFFITIVVAQQTCQTVHVKESFGDDDFMGDDSRKMDDSDGERQCLWLGRPFWQRPRFCWRCQNFSTALNWIYWRIKASVVFGNTWTNPQFITLKWAIRLFQILGIMGKWKWPLCQHHKV